MSLCASCRGWREGNTVHLPHEKVCRGRTNAGGAVAGTSPVCTCSCTPLELKDTLEADHNYRSWIALTEPHTSDQIRVVQPSFPLDTEVHLEFVSDKCNTTVVRVTHEGAEHLLSALLERAKSARFIDTDTIAAYVYHAIEKAASGADLKDVVAELPMGLDRRVLALGAMSKGEATTRG